MPTTARQIKKSQISADGLRAEIEKMKRANLEAQKFLRQIDERIAALDMRYAELLVGRDIDTLKAAKRIVTRRVSK